MSMIKHIKRRMSLGKARSSKSEEVHAFVLNLRKPMGLTAKDKTLIISTIDKNGQADKGGLQIGDVITSVGGIDVKNIGDVQASLANFRKKGEKEVIICCTHGAVYLARKKEQNMEEVALLLAAAEDGDAEAQYKLGVAYSHGFLGLDENQEDAVRWWKAAVEQGFPDAQVSLGIAYYTGKVVNETNIQTRRKFVNYEKALELFQAAAANNSCQAKTNLACMYLEGRGVTRNVKTAMRMLRQASSEGLGDIQADLLLAMIYEKGLSTAVPRDMTKSVDLFKRLNAVRSSTSEHDEFDDMITKHRTYVSSAKESPKQGSRSSLSFRSQSFEDKEVKKEDHLEEMAEQRAASVMAARESRAEKEKKRQERIQSVAERVGEGSVGRSKRDDESIPPPENAQQLKDAMAEELQKIVYMNPTVFFNILDTDRMHALSHQELANGFNKFTPFRVVSDDDVIQEVMDELDVGNKGYVSAGDIKDRWHVLAGGPPRVAAARRRSANTTTV